MTYRTYKVRWLLIVLVSSTAFNRYFISRAFSVVNNVVAAYYKVDPYLVDVLALVDSVPVAPISFSTILFGELLGLRSLILLDVTLLFLGTLLIVIGCVSRSLYAFAAIGSAITGIPVALMYVIPPILAAHWFSKDETAIVLSFSPSFMSFGSCLAAILFPYLIPYDEKISDITQYNISSHAQYNITDGGNYERFILLSTFGSCCILAFIFMILAFIFAKDNPPTPPSAAQENIINIRSSRPEVSVKEHVKKQLGCVKELFKNKPFLLNITMIMLYSALNFVYVLLPSMILGTLPGISNKTVGEIFFATMLIAGIGYALAGKVVDKLKKFKLIVAVACVVFGVSLVVIYFGFKYKNLPTIICCFPIIGFFEGFFCAAQIELLIETTYPANKFILSSVYVSSYFVSAFIFTSVDRFLMEYFDETYVILYTMVLMFIKLLLLALIEPKYKRMVIDMQAAKDERQLLLNKADE